jgi:nucleotide-binding universal stress UspA family protein
MENIMFKTILLPTDGSALTEKAIPTAIDFAKLTGGKIIGIYVIQPLPLTAIADGGIAVDVGIYEQQMRDAAQIHIDKLGEAARAAGVTFEGIIAQSVNPYEEIIDASIKFNCDIILMASHGRKGLNKLFLGSETQKVLAHTTLPVMVLR